MTVRIFVPDIPACTPFIEAARQSGDYRILQPDHGYWCIEADQEIRFERKPMGIGPALWNSALTGGFCGRITEYGRDVMRIENED